MQTTTPPPTAAAADAEHEQSNEPSKQVAVGQTDYFDYDYCRVLARLDSLRIALYAIYICRYIYADRYI